MDGRRRKLALCAAIAGILLLGGCGSERDEGVKETLGGIMYERPTGEMGKTLMRQGEEGLFISYTYGETGSEYSINMRAMTYSQEDLQESIERFKAGFEEEPGFEAEKPEEISVAGMDGWKVNFSQNFTGKGGNAIRVKWAYQMFYDETYLYYIMASNYEKDGDLAQNAMENLAKTVKRSDAPASLDIDCEAQDYFEITFDPGQWDLARIGEPAGKRNSYTRYDQEPSGSLDVLAKPYNGSVEKAEKQVEVMLKELHSQLGEYSNFNTIVETATISHKESVALKRLPLEEEAVRASCALDGRSEYYGEFAEQREMKEELFQSSLEILYFVWEGNLYLFSQRINENESAPWLVEVMDTIKAGKEGGLL